MTIRNARSVRNYTVDRIGLLCVAGGEYVICVGANIKHGSNAVSSMTNVLYAVSI